MLRKLCQKSISVLLCLSMLLGIFFAGGSVCFAAALSEGECGEGVIYSFDSDSGTLTISGEGAMTDYPAFNKTPFLYHSEIINVIVQSGVSALGDYCFYGCSGIQSVSLPETLERIGKSAFYNDTAIESISLPDSVTAIGESAFYFCKKLQSVNIPKGVTVLEHGVFSYCTSLSAVNFHKDVRAIGGTAFYNCTALTDCVLPASLEYIGQSAFNNCSALESVDIPAAVETIEAKAFYNCSSLADITFSVGLKSIGYEAFVYCTALEEVTLPNGLESIGNSAFSACTKLKAVNLPLSLTFVGEAAFSNSGLEEFVIPSNVAASARMLSGCTALKKVTVEDGVIALGEDIFWKCASLEEVRLPQTLTALPKGCFRACSALKEIMLPRSVQAVGEYAFRDCSALESITLPQGISTVPKGCFYTCKKLTEVALPDSVQSIGESSFYACSALKGISLPFELKSIGKSAFASCTSLETITIPRTVTTISTGVFTGAKQQLEVWLYSGKINANNLIASMKKGMALHAYSSVSGLEQCNTRGINLQIIAEIDCDNGKHDYAVERTEPTCSAAGEACYTCLACGDSYTEVLPAAHTFVQARTEPTCVAEGEIRSVCSVCGEVQTELLPKAAHKLVTKIVKGTVNYAGGKTMYCSVCRTVFSYQHFTQIGTLILSKTTFVYSGKNCRPTLLIKDITGKNLSTAYYTVSFVKNSTAIGKYAVVVQLKGNYEGKHTLYYTVVPKSTTISKLIPSKNTITVYWKRLGGITGYQVEYSVYSNFQSSKKMTVHNKNMYFDTIRKLSSGKTYYLRIRTYKTVGKNNCFSSWSKTYKVKTK